MPVGGVCAHESRLSGEEGHDAEGDETHVLIKYPEGILFFPG